MMRRISALFLAAMVLSAIVVYGPLATSTKKGITTTRLQAAISGNVGALSKYFNLLVQSRFYNRSKEEAYHIVKRAPLGDSGRARDRGAGGRRRLAGDSTRRPAQEPGLRPVGPTQLRAHRRQCARALRLIHLPSRDRAPASHIEFFSKSEVRASRVDASGPDLAFNQDRVPTR